MGYLLLPLASSVEDGELIGYYNNEQLIAYKENEYPIKFCAYYTDPLWHVIIASNDSNRIGSVKVYRTSSSSAILNANWSLTSSYGDFYYATGNFSRSESANITSMLYYANSESEALQVMNDGVWNYITYPITYQYTNSIVSGPAEAAVGDTVTVSAVPDVDYGITDPTTQIVVTNNDVPVNFMWDASTNRITFTMPDPT